jgi:hypothetical protein
MKTVTGKRPAGLTEKPIKTEKPGRILTDQSNSVTATRTFARREWVENTHLGAKPML